MCFSILSWFLKFLIWGVNIQAKSFMNSKVQNLEPFLFNKGKHFFLLQKFIDIWQVLYKINI
jgi:hypothetical protein